MTTATAPSAADAAAMTPQAAAASTSPAASVAAPASRRSHSGCIECRRMHRKCDEKKPSCAACVRGKKTCSYGLKLSWGGRPFGKSRFGKCINESGNLKKVDAGGNTQFSFVYGLETKKVKQQTEKKDASRASPTTSQSPSSSPSMALVRTTAQVPPLSAMPTPQPFARMLLSSIGRNPDLYSWLVPAQRSLIDHYLSSTSYAITCLDKTRRDYCNLIFPMALETPHLLSALMCLSAVHRGQQGLPQSPAQIEHLRASAVNQLRLALQSPSEGASEMTAATTLSLCMAEIAQGGERPHSWRLHLSGAAAILDQIVLKDLNSRRQLSQTKLFLQRWYASIECIAFLCGQPFQLSESRRPSRLATASVVISNSDEANGESTSTSYVIDDLAGCSVSLLPILEEISRLTLLRDIEDAETIQARRTRCEELIAQVHHNLSRTDRPVPGTETVLDPVFMRDLITLDTTFHHMALLQIYQRAGDIPSSSPESQLSVRAIIDGVSDMTFVKSSCPSVAVLQPLFTAGCEAVELEDRESILRLMGLMESTFSMGNVKTARAVLVELWGARDGQGDTAGRIRWDRLIAEKGWDMLAY